MQDAKVEARIGRKFRWVAIEAVDRPRDARRPMSPLRWTCKSTSKLAEELTQQNHPVSDLGRSLYREAEQVAKAVNGAH